jgi:hypothetical protein
MGAGAAFLYEAVNGPRIVSVRERRPTSCQTESWT